VLEEHGTLLLEQPRRVGAGESLVEDILNGDSQARLPLGLLPRSSANEVFTRSNSSRATFFASARSVAFNSGPGRVSRSNTVADYIAADLEAASEQFAAIVENLKE
jgi:hypothetical protein